MDLEELEVGSLDADEPEEMIESNENGGPIHEEGQQFDISIPALHSYMGPDLNDVCGRVVLEAGWCGSIPALVHHGVVFPGETVPMLLNNQHNATVIADILAKDKLFGLLSPVAGESRATVSGYGVVCEVFEAAPPLAGAGRGQGWGEAEAHVATSFKARAVHRFRLKDMNQHPLFLYNSFRYVEVVVLPEVQPAHPLRHARLAALDAARRPHARPAAPTQGQASVRRLDAALTPWPHFVYEMFDFTRMRSVIHQHYEALGLERLLPEEPVSLSFWVASNLPLSPHNRLALFMLDDSMARLHKECEIIAKKSFLCCASCGTEVSRHELTIAMSTDGAHSNYTNPGGYMHDILTVSRAWNARAAGEPSDEFSWFPGYLWSVAVCARCDQHIGWRFDARSRTLQPRKFYALCRNYVIPRESGEEQSEGAPPL